MENVDCIIEYILKLSPNGKTMTELWDDCTIAPDRLSFAYALNVCVKNGSLYYVDRRYYRFKKNIPKQVKPVKQDKPEPEPSFWSRPKGSLTRSTNLGTVAMALYSFRDRFLSLADLREIVGHDLQVTSIVSELSKKGYAYYRHTLDDVFVRWSDKFEYPFVKQSNGDSDRLKQTPDKFIVENNPTVCECNCSTKEPDYA